MFTDSHCHLDFPIFQHDLEDVLIQANKVGVNQFLVPATTQQSWVKVHSLVNQYKSVRGAYGIHPYFLTSQKLSDLEFLEAFAVNNQAVAIGEIGLDYWPGQVNAEIQRHFFCKQLDIAQNLNLPVVLHARKSYDQLFSILKKYQLVGGVIHAFTGSQVQAQRFLQLGFLLGIGGTISYPRGHKTRQLLLSLSDDDFVLETDSPDMPLFGFQGQRNTPAKIRDVAKIVSETRQQNLENIAYNCQNNILKAFPKWNVKEV